MRTQSVIYWMVPRMWQVVVATPERNYVTCRRNLTQIRCDANTSDYVKFMLGETVEQEFEEKMCPSVDSEQGKASHQVYRQ